MSAVVFSLELFVLVVVECWSSPPPLPLFKTSAATHRELGQKIVS